MASLLIVDAGIVHEIPPSGLVIGRDPGCCVVLDSPEVSRRHARVEWRATGYHITDDSTNGVFVNGERAAESQLLAEGDVVRIGDVIFRFSAAAAARGTIAMAPAPATRAPAAPFRGEISQPTTPMPRRHRSETGEPLLLATLDVLSGSVPHGMRFRIERPVVQLGRGAASDVCLADETVSGAHATLMLRDATWHLLDHSSFNGTYVNGIRVHQCALPGTCELRLGAVTLRFQVASN